MRYSIPVMRGIIALAAILIWANVNSFAFQNRTIDSPLQITGIKEDQSVANPLAPVKVSVSGKARNLNKITSENLVFSIDLNGVSSGSTVDAPVQLIKSPANVNIFDWEPKNITLSVEDAVTKTLPIFIETTNSVADGYTISSVTTDPDTVEVWGSPSLLATISDLSVSVDVRSKKQSFVAPAIPRAVLASGIIPTNIKIKPESVSVHINIEKGSATRTLGIRPTLVGDLPSGYHIKEIKFDPPVVTIQGNHRALNALDDIFSSPIQLSDQRKTFTQKASVDLPRGLKTVGENLVDVQVIIELNQSSREFTISPEFINLTEGFGVSGSDPKSIRVVVVGDESALQDISRKDVQLNIDLQGVLSGSSSVDISSGMFSLPSGLSIGSFTPDKIEVILSRL